MLCDCSISRVSTLVLLQQFHSLEPDFYVDLSLKIRIIAVITNFSERLPIITKICNNMTNMRHTAYMAVNSITVWIIYWPSRHTMLKKTTLNQRQNVASTLNRRCLNVELAVVSDYDWEIHL